MSMRVSAALFCVSLVSAGWALHSAITLGWVWLTVLTTLIAVGVSVLATRTISRTIDSVEQLAWHSGKAVGRAEQAIADLEETQRIMSDLQSAEDHERET